MCIIGKEELWLFRPFASLPLGFFAFWLVCPWLVCPWLIRPWLICPLALAPWLVRPLCQADSPFGLFTLWLVRPLADSPR